MKINEIVTESDVGDLANLSAKNVSTGYDAVNKLFSPSQWFKGSVKTDDEPIAQKSAPVKQKVSSTAHLEKEAVMAASQGKELYRADLAQIKIVYQKVKSGKISVDDNETTLLSLKALLKGQQLSDQQKSALAQLSNQL